jgi:ABC-2 type transport system ATP-binding protein
VIRVENIKKYFEDIRAVDDISFDIKSGQITGFLGPNGAGKSTTLKMIVTYLQPTAGDIYINDVKLGEHRDDIRKLIGYLPEHNPLYTEMLVWDYLKYMAELKEIPAEQIRERILYVSQRCGITDRLPQIIGTLSKGYRQRVGLASAILHDPQILILDEPTSGLDPNQILEIRNLIRELGADKTVILSSHILQEIQALCERIIIIHRGKIIADTTKEKLLRDMKQKHVLHLTLNDSIDPEIFCHIDEAIEAHLINAEQHNYSISYPVEYDFREQIFDTVCQHNLKIYELYIETQKLEDAFTYLTADSHEISE